jgi:LytS/YehU family sensor histidine kinase
MEKDFLTQLRREELEGSIPPFLIQTLLENALKHSTGENFSIFLKVGRDGNKIKIEVQNPSEGAIKFIEGHSLYILREKLKRIYKDSCIFPDKNGDMVKISISIPGEND